MTPTPEKIKRELKRLRKIVETSECDVEKKIAYAMEKAIRWATEETVGWIPPSKDVANYANDLKEIEMI